jgi:hypothetical protein
VLNNQLWVTEKGWSPVQALSEGVTSPPFKKFHGLGLDRFFGNHEKNKLRKFLLPFDSESPTFLFETAKHYDCNM